LIIDFDYLTYLPPELELVATKRLTTKRRSTRVSSFMSEDILNPEESRKRIVTVQASRPGSEGVGNMKKMPRDVRIGFDFAFGSPLDAILVI